MYTTAIQSYEPEVEVDVKGGILYKDDCHLDPQKLMQSLYQYLQSAGVKFMLRTTVQAFEKGDGKIKAAITDKGKVACEELVIANGSWMGNISKGARHSTINATWQRI